MKTFEPGTLCFFHRNYPGKRAETALRRRSLGPAALIGPHHGELPTEPPGEPEEPSCDDRDIGMVVVEQMIQEQQKQRHQQRSEEMNIVERTHAWDHGYPPLAAISDEETAGSLQFKRARLEESLKDEREKTVEDEIEQIGPENVLMTKSLKKEPFHQQQTLFQTNINMIATYHFVIYSRQMCPCTWATQGSIKIHSAGEAAEFRQQVPRERRLHS